MKRTLQGRTLRLRHLAMLLVILFGAASASAALESDDINAAILQEGSVPVHWTNDASHPWILSEDGTYVRTPETEGDTQFISTLSFSYTSAYPVELYSEWYRYTRHNDDILKLLIDGEEVRQTTWGSWSIDEYSDFNYIMIPAGSHTVSFVSESYWDGWYYDLDPYFSGIRNIRVWECKELESSALQPGSMPLNFVNDPESMWITENGYIRSSNWHKEDSSSKISVTFTIDHPSLFAYECQNGYDYYDTCWTNVYVDGVAFREYRSTEWTPGSVVLYPGTHTIEFENKHSGYYAQYTSRLRNIKLDQNWINVTLNTPGELGVRLLQALGDKNLQDAELVKIKGAMNADDWAIVRQLSGAKAIDFTESPITSVPAEACRDLKYLSTVMLPETVTEIGGLAFYGTDFHQITVPASVERIRHQVWESTPLQYISFAPQSKLKSIGYCAFRYTKLLEFTMPDSVTEIERYGHAYGNGNWSENYYDEWNILAECHLLKKLHLSDGLEFVGRGVAYQCDSLEEVHLPVNAKEIEWDAFYGTNLKSIDLPETLTKLSSGCFQNSALETVRVPKGVTTYGSSVFSGCRNLKEAHMNSHCWDMVATFYDCQSLQTVVLPCATPPTIDTYYYNEPFYNVDKSKITLFVPDFALEAYKADPFWYQFTNTRVSDEASINDYWSIRGNLTINDAHKVQGIPSFEIMPGGTLTMDTDIRQNFNEFTYNNRESQPGVFLSKSNSVNANKFVARYYVEQQGRWYFFSPVTDVRMSDVTFSSTDAWVIRYYDGARRANEDTSNGNWINMPSNGILRHGQGYIIHTEAPGWLELPAATAEHDKFFGQNEVTLALADNPCETAANAGWNFVANPYPSYYDIYYIDMQAPITVWDGNTYRAFSLNDGDRGDDNYVLRPMQPFFVQKATADLSTRMPLVGRQINTAIDRTRAPRRTPTNATETREKLNLQILTGDNEEADDYTRIVINELASTGYETLRDASKFMSLNAEVAQLYSLGEQNHPMAINERPYAEGSVRLGVYIPADGVTYRIAATRADRQAWLHDSETGMEHDLTTGDYLFTARKGFDNNRFSIRFSPASTAVEGIDVASVKVSGQAGQIVITGAEGKALKVYAADGSLKAEMTADSNLVEIPAAGGIYIVKAGEQTFKTIVK